MNANTHTLRFGRAIGAALSLGALVVTVGCAGRDTGLSAQPLTATMGQTGTPTLVSCEPHQRALVRPVVINGAAVSQVECVSVGQLQAQPVVTQSAYRPVSAAQPVYAQYGDASVAPVVTTRSARPVQTRQVIYDDVRPARQTRSVKKSAIIIGSSAGVGAGVGAAVGGKKGALIGAAIGGGSAAIWDQVTRRDR
jgi:hypothetical protein